MSARHNEDFLKTHINEDFFDKCLLNADGKQFTSVDSLVKYLGNEKVITEMTSWNGGFAFDCKISGVVEFLSKVKR
ncbi:hypothetical protein [Enterobacter oligotrophicus]|uniref:hypothetical protein n=1 Tax=Enterobacter oligotrophicus TaxID=2478464 RepID=UPI0028AAF127|nr:hypothetical protein [Enterobacter oligotrophicus]